MSTLLKLFKKYKDEETTLIETGTYNGVGVSTALKAGYDFILSFEIVEDLVKVAKEMFHNDSNVVIYSGSSSDTYFQYMCSQLDKPCVFWLDAHKMGGGGTIPDDYPLIAELEAIGNSEHCHTVLMDDFRLFERYGVTIEDVKKHLTKDGIEYIISKETIRENYPNDVLCFKPNKTK